MSLVLHMIAWLIVLVFSVALVLWFLGILMALWEWIETQ